MLGVSELIVLFLLVIPLALVAMFSAVWVYRDAQARQNPNATVWTIGTVIVWPLVLVLYLILRPDFRTNL